MVGDHDGVGGVGMTSDRDLIVTLKNGFAAPGGDGGMAEVFRAAERSQRDDVTMYFDVNIPNVSVVTVSNDEIRAEVTLNE